MENNDVIYPALILSAAEKILKPMLVYSPSTRCILLNRGSGNIKFLDIYTKKIVKELVIPEMKEYGSGHIGLSSDGLLLATDSVYQFHEPSNIVPTQLRIFDISNNSVDHPEKSCSVKPDFGSNRILTIKFFPDGSKIVAINIADPLICRSPGSWCRIFRLPEELWELEESVEIIKETVRNNKTLNYDEIDVEKQGFLFDEEARGIKLASEKDEEFMHKYSEALYGSKMNGFYCVAISPDTTRLLAGNQDGEIFIIDAGSLKILQCIRAYWYYVVVTECSYNPTLGHEQFATCDEMGNFDIWGVNTSPDGNEEACSVHRLALECETGCSYSPDGKLIAVASNANFKTYIIDSESACIVYNLVYREDVISNYNGWYCPSLFIGHSCQVATVYCNECICFWNLPVVYSLKTLCLVLLRSVVNFKSIEQLPLPSPMKLRLKYLYV